MKKNISRKNWIQNQHKDQYFKKSQILGYRSRSAFKLIELDKKFKFLKNGIKLLDVGSFPGGWCQVAKAKIKNGKILGIDKKKIEEIRGVKFIKGDFLDEKSKKIIIEYFNSSIDVILSDMAVNSSGHRFTDQANAEKVYYLAKEFALKYLKKNGSFVCKFFRNSLEKTILQNIKQKFNLVKIYKPNSSRKDSKEIYLIAIGFNNLHKV